MEKNAHPFTTLSGDDRIGVLIGAADGPNVMVVVDHGNPLIAMHDAENRRRASLECTPNEIVASISNRDNQPMVRVVVDLDGRVQVLKRGSDGEFKVISEY